MKNINSFLLFSIVYISFILLFNQTMGRKAIPGGMVPYLIIALPIVLASMGFYWLMNYIAYKKGPVKKILDTALEFEQAEVFKIKKNDNQFDPKEFLKGVKRLATILNQAWCENKMDLVRNMVSAGIYNRFRIQLDLMLKDKTKNIMADWVLSRLNIRSVEVDEVYETIHLELTAYARDANITTGLSPEEEKNIIENTPQTYYSEIWSFVRKKGLKTEQGKFLLSGNCPNCGGDISGKGQLSKCGYCGSIVNSGEFDWVLAEITQHEEWRPNLSSGSIDLSEFQASNGLVSRQIIEDRASVLFWRWIQAGYFNSRTYLSRETEKERLDTIALNHSGVHDVAVGAVDLNGCQMESGKIKAEVLILWSGADTNLSESLHREHYLTLAIQPSSNSKNGLSGNSCPNCGAPLPESDSLNCDYCSAEVPAITDDWLLSSIREKN
ncbi:MAG: TIM44-like domain-containing protein [Leptospiraceae bacterium]|nr:TIM44-like domain-containing protein [Leptospiraceae bacterium]MCP5512508.1 TIM44-like domain-containing protein [Leptospiraceae bacterium]